MKKIKENQFVKWIMAICFVIGVSTASYAQVNESTPAQEAANLKQQLNLTDDQTSKIEHITEEFRKSKEHQILIDSLGIWINAKQIDKIFKVSDSYNIRVESVMTDAQKEKYQASIKRSRDQLQEIANKGGYMRLPLKPLKPKIDTIIHGNYTLVFDIKDSLKTSTREQLVNLFFKVYPEEVKTFNPNAPKKVTWHIDDLGGKVGVAGTATDQTWFNPKWFQEHPEDIDCATHELMHIVQAYGARQDLPGWLTEGIADYVRYKFGVNNIRANWKLPEFDPNQSYSNGYRTTARFLVWLEQHKKDKSIVKDLNDAVREGTYSLKTWTKLTGESLDTLWKDYAGNPAVELHYQ